MVDQPVDVRRGAVPVDGLVVVFGSDSFIETFCRSADSKLPTPIDAMSSMVSVSRALMRLGFAVTAVSAPAVSLASPPFATAPAGTDVVTVISENPPLPTLGMSIPRRGAIDGAKTNGCTGATVTPVPVVGAEVAARCSTAGRSDSNKSRGT